jgi:hypothetical protein
MAAIDWTKFLTTIYAPDGTFIANGLKNELHEFYYGQLLTGQVYYVAFFYDGMLLLCIRFISDEISKVNLINLQLIIANANCIDMPAAIRSVLQEAINKALDYNVPIILAHNKALDTFILSTHEGIAKTLSNYPYICFDAGKSLEAIILKK